MILALHAVEIALLVWIVLLLRKPATAQHVIGRLTEVMPNVAPETSPQRVLMLCGPDGAVQHEVSTSKIGAEFPKDYEYSGTIYRLVVADAARAQYRAVAGPQAKRAVTRGR